MLACGGELHYSSDMPDGNLRGAIGLEAQE